MESKVIDNALDFVGRAAILLWDDSMAPEQQLKYSTIHLFEGIELFLKARLMQDHWSLILRDPDKYRAGTMQPCGIGLGSTQSMGRMTRWPGVKYVVSKRLCPQEMM